MTSQALLVVNPAARGLPRRERLAAAAAWLRGRGWQVETEATGRQGHATSLARRATQAGYTLVVACGGDGTINEVVNGLAGSETALAVIPGGTANVWAREAAIPRDPLKAVAVAAEGESRRIDLGRVTGEGERYFLLMAGIGFDAYVIHRLSPGAKERWGALAYVAIGLGVGLGYRGAEAHVVLDGEPIAGAPPGEVPDFLFMVVGNTRSYGGVLEITPRARADDGLLDVCLFTGRGLPGKIGLLLRVLARSHLGAGGVLYRRARRLEVWGPESLFVQADGELCATTPVVIEARPQALTVKLPPGGARRLLGP